MILELILYSFRKRKHKSYEKKRIEDTRNVCLRGELKYGIVDEMKDTMEHEKDDCLIRKCIENKTCECKICCDTEV